MAPSGLNRGARPNSGVARGSCDSARVPLCLVWVGSCSEGSVILAIVYGRPSPLRHLCFVRCWNRAVGPTHSAQQRNRNVGTGHQSLNSPPAGPKVNLRASGGAGRRRTAIAQARPRACGDAAPLSAPPGRRPATAACASAMEKVCVYGPLHRGGPETPVARGLRPARGLAALETPPQTGARGPDLGHDPCF